MRTRVLVLVALAMWTSVVAGAQGVNIPLYNPLGAYYGLKNGSPNPTWKGAENLGPDIAQSPVQGIDAGPTLDGTNGHTYTTSFVAGMTGISLTGNGTQKYLRTCYNMNNGGNQVGEYVYRFSYDVTTTCNGNFGLSYVWTDSTQVAVTTPVFILGNVTGLTHYQSMVEIKHPITNGSNAVQLQIRIYFENNCNAGSFTINSAHIYRVARAIPPLTCGWQNGSTVSGAAPTTAGSGVVDMPVTRADGRNFIIRNLIKLDAPNASNGPYSPTERDIYDTTLSNYTAGISAGTMNQSVQGPNFTLSNVSVFSFDTANLSQIQSVQNAAATAYELRLNSHGGEYAASTGNGGAGVIGTDWILQFDMGDGTGWHQVNDTGMMHQCRRFQFIAHTKTWHSDDAVNPFETTDCTYTFFADGTVRHDRTVTFLTTCLFNDYFYWMTALSPGDAAIPARYFPSTNGFTGVGRIGAGVNVLGSVDYNGYLVTPTGTGVSTSTTGGSIATGTLCSYRVSAMTLAGETTASAAVTVTTGAGSTNSNTVSWASQTYALAYRVYGRVQNQEFLLATLPSNATSWVDTGAGGYGGFPPASNTAQLPNSPGAYDSADSVFADWACYQEQVSALCFWMGIDRSEAIAQTGATNVRTRILRASNVTKIYCQLESGATAGAPSTVNGNSSNLFFIHTFNAGTVLKTTMWLGCYAPTVPSVYERDLGMRFSQPALMKQLYLNN